MTHVSFNLKDYILIVGDDRGVVHALKLSPNLRKLTLLEDVVERSGGDGGDEGREGKELDEYTIQRYKMLRLLASIDKKYASEV